MKKRSPLVIGASGIAALALAAGAYVINDGNAEGKAAERPAVAAGQVAGTEPVTQPLRDEHKELMPHIEELRAAGDAVGNAQWKDLRAKTATAHTFLAGHLVPHAQAEDKVLYAEIDRLLGNVPVTATMRRDHVEVEKLTAELETLQGQLTKPPNAQAQRDLRRVLYGSYTLVKLHFAKEEEVYLPILDKRLTAEQARELFERMEQVGGQDGGHGGQDSGHGQDGGH
ncbi:hemerythrin domain-containing protein [Actinomadura latina]|uniref:Hemerythrin domain-containing protein n=1 Tax=Actinomadura latina TaxID=163603 RepID=A0A846Z8X4_9ACTN|nr:hemerythrin domain-containing protein [Actinomadura latina]NKZ06853.1 hemerythrin domain-containing protein [Actinomadura latina]